MNLKLAIQCAEAIAALYAKTLAPTIVAKRTDTQVRIEQAHDGEFIILFPGTASLTDWWTDMKVRKAPWEAGRVHRGFAAAYNSVCEEIREATKDATRLIITGHSLGGALATLCAHDLMECGHEISEVITFGCPRVGNGSFARAYNHELGHCTWRVVNARDPVPKVPFVLGTYRHVDTQVYLPWDGGIQVDEPLRVHLEEKIRGVKQALDGFNGAPEFISISAHAITSYLAKLKALA